MKTFNVHYAVDPGPIGGGKWNPKRRGFTAVVEQDYSQDFVNVYVSFCSRKDEFNKKVGVAKAKGKKVYQRVHKKGLPTLLGGLYAEVQGWEFVPSFRQRYDYVLRNFF